MRWWPAPRPFKELPHPDAGRVEEKLERLVRPAPRLGWVWVLQVATTTWPDAVARQTEHGVELQWPTTTRTVLESGWRLTERGARTAARRAETRDGRGKWLRA